MMQAFTLLFAPFFPQNLGSAMVANHPDAKIKVVSTLTAPRSGRCLQLRAKSSGMEA